MLCIAGVGILRSGGTLITKIGVVQGLRDEGYCEGDDGGTV